MSTEPRLRVAQPPRTWLAWFDRRDKRASWAAGFAGFVLGALTATLLGPWALMLTGMALFTAVSVSTAAIYLLDYWTEEN